MEYTKNHHLPQWAETDRILMEDFNQAMANIDAGLDTVKAFAENGQEGLAASLEALSTAVGSGGHTARVAAGSYTGNREPGTGRTLTFDFIPFLVVVNEAAGHFAPTIMIRGSTSTSAQSGSMLPLTWNSNSVTWGSTSYDHDALNDNETYCYVAIGYSA